MTHLGMISYQGPAGACDGRAQVTPGYRSGGQTDWGQTDYIRTKWREVGLTALSSSPTTNMDLLWQLTYRLHMHSTRTAYNRKWTPVGLAKNIEKKNPLYKCYTNASCWLFYLRGSVLYGGGEGACELRRRVIHIQHNNLSQAPAVIRLTPILQPTKYNSITGLRTFFYFTRYNRPKRDSNPLPSVYEFMCGQPS